MRERDFLSKERAAAAAEIRLLADADIDQRLIPLVYVIDGAIVGMQREKFRDLQDEEALAGVENALQNIETESSGLIYEHHSSSPRVQEVSNKIRHVLDELIEKRDLGDRVTRTDLIAALKYVRFRVGLHVRRAEKDPNAARGFMRQVSLFYPWPEEATSPLII